MSLGVGNKNMENEPKKENINEALKQEILAMVETDQKMRKSHEWDPEVDKNNTKRMKEIIKLITGVIIFLVWVYLTFWSTNQLISTLTPKAVFFGDEFTCGHKTIQECAEKEVQPRTVKIINNNFAQILQDMEKINIILQLPLKILQFNMYIEESGNGIPDVLDLALWGVKVFEDIQRSSLVFRKSHRQKRW